jgi:AraC-like DNA-binding protein
MINFASRAEYRRRIEQVVVYINAHMGEALDLATLAGVSNFSALHFPRIFQAAMNETPLAYVERLRVERAARTLMASQNIPVTDVATACGFSSASTFTKAFKNHYGVSAREYSKGRYLESLADSCGIQSATMASGEKKVWEVSLREMDGQTWAVFHVECQTDEVEAQYLAIYRDWLPDSGFEPADLQSYEVNLQIQDQDPDGFSKKDIYLPLKPVYIL